MIYAICNPTAGNGRGRTIGVQIEAALKGKKLPCRMLLTKAPGHATLLARQACAQGADTVLSIGGDGTALEVARAKRYCHGLLPYLYGVLQTLFRFRSVPITYSLDGGKSVTRDAFVVGVANGGMIGGGIPIAPEAKADDGLLEVVVVDKIQSRHLISRLIGLMQGKILTFPETHYCRASSVSFSTPNMRVNIDGEIVPEKEVVARVLPGALMIHR